MAAVHEFPQHPGDTVSVPVDQLRLGASVRLGPLKSEHLELVVQLGGSGSPVLITREVAVRDVASWMSSVTPTGEFRNVVRNRAYVQVAEQLRDAIRDGCLAPGDEPPTERDLSAQVAVSRTTVCEAPQALAVGPRTSARW